MSFRVEEDVGQIGSNQKKERDQPVSSHNHTQTSLKSRSCKLKHCPNDGNSCLLSKTFGTGSLF